MLVETHLFLGIIYLCDTRCHYEEADFVDHGGAENTTEQDKIADNLEDLEHRSESTALEMLVTWHHLELVPHPAAWADVYFCYALVISNWRTGETKEQSGFLLKQY